MVPWRHGCLQAPELHPQPLRRNPPQWRVLELDERDAAALEQLTRATQDALVPALGVEGEVVDALDAVFGGEVVEGEARRRHAVLR